jgi:hypothetical protein
MRRISILVALVATFALAGTALAAPSTWKVYNYWGATGMQLRAAVASVASDGTVSFTLPTDTFYGAAYLTTAKVGNFGDLAGQTMSATVGITADAGTTFLAWETCATPTVGLYFETKAKGKFNPSAYWWSSDRRLLSDLLNTTTLLSTPLTAGSWTNYNGQTDPDGFAAAVANVTTWGVSFGGCGGYANGVAASNSSAVFTLTP